MTAKPAPPALPILLKRAAELLAARFGHATFLAGQEDALRSILSRRSLLVIMPTGSGKSLLYQLPALMEGGLTLVVSPLIALMKDQVDELTRKGIPAAFVNSSLSPDEQRARLARCVDGGIRLLYVAPERFRSAAFLDMLSRARISRMAVDEAHCISQWGHDFRPDYRRLKDFRERMGRPPVTALTATATPAVQSDIVASLGLDPADVDVHVHGFDRPNLRLRVVRTLSDGDKQAFLREFVGSHPGAGIIYTGTRKLAEDLAEVLQPVEPTLVVYHAGLEPAARTAAQEAFLGGRARVVLATMAFGMGIDKADVRFVVHTSYPASLEQYYQEIGRAGRDGRPSDCVLLHDPGDRRLREFFIDLNYPPRAIVREVYEALWQIEDNPVMMTYREIADLCSRDAKDGHVGAAIRLLDDANLTRALAGEPKIAVTTSAAGEDLLGRVKGPVQRRVLEALSASVDLESPGRYELELRDLCRASGLEEDAVRRALSAMDREGLLVYDPPFRGRGIEKLTASPPAFDAVPIDWERQEARRAEEERKLGLMEDYIRTTSCRREFILRYFGEETKLACTTCDRCEPPSGTALPGGVLALDSQLALGAVAHLRFPLGKALVKKVLKGSRDKRILEWELDRNPFYGAIRAERADVDAMLDDLVRQGYLDAQAAEHGNVLVLTERGRAAAAPSPAAIKRAATPAPAMPVKPVPTVVAPAAVQDAVIRCLTGLRAPVGTGKVAEVLTGSRAKWIAQWHADRLPVYGVVRADQEEVKSIIEQMLAEGLLERDSTSRRPVLQVTDAGRKRLGGEAAAAPAQAVKPVTASAPKKDADPGKMLDAMLRDLLTAEAEDAKELIEPLGVFDGGEITARLEKAYNIASTPREKKRAVWAAGELGGPEGLKFLLAASIAESADVRRIAASALGKAGALAVGRQRLDSALLSDVRSALGRLASDPVAQVSQYARRALDHIERR